MIPAIFAGVAAVALLLASALDNHRKQVTAARAAKVRQAWIDDRIRNERDPGRRAAWRIIRDDNLGDL